MDILFDISKRYFRTDLPSLQVGDRVEVTTKHLSNLSKNEKEERLSRLARFRGTVIAQRNRGQISYTFSVLKESSKLMIRSVFSYHSPLIVSITKFGKIKKVRRAKLYYLERELSKKKDNE